MNKFKNKDTFVREEICSIKPNFFIVGAPKCGTTALSEYLRVHPNIFMSDPKEPMYFSKDIKKIRVPSISWVEYINLFQECEDEHVAIGEASVNYLISSVAISNIHYFNEKAKIIVMLRNPVDMVQSLHSQRVYSQMENETDFEKAWNLQDSRKKGMNLPNNYKYAFDLMYKDFAMYGNQMERLFSIFPREQVKIIFFDDFKRSTQEIYGEILDFLNVPFDGRTDFPIMNANKTIRIYWLESILRKIINKFERPANKIKKKLRIKKFGVDKILLLNTRHIKRTSISPSFRDELLNEFKGDVEKLSYLLNKDLSNWLK